jgi:DNA-binding LytR/AlgR family response regulator
MIVDDEPIALDILESFIQKIDDLQLVARCDNAIEAFNLLHKESIDLLFLDIEMPKLDGIKLIKTLKEPPKVILTTAYRDYAIEGYTLDVIDYLLKPISFERFLLAITKVNRRSSISTGTLSLSVHAPEKLPPHIFLKVDKKMVKVPLCDILYIEGLSNYVKVITTHKCLITYQKLSYLEQKLPEGQFIRIHRSFIIALEKIEAYTPNAVEISGKALPISRNYKNEVLKILEENGD